jgi:multimeric flavodoxin WrbA
LTDRRSGAIISPAHYSQTEEPDVKLLALMGSPRKRWNTDTLTDAVLRGAKEAGAEVEKVYLDDFSVRPIAEVCDDRRKREDLRADDDFPGLLDKLLDAEIILWATPVYWQGVSAQMKCFIDRLSSYFGREPYAQRFDGKGHIVVCTYGRKEPETARWVTEPMKVTVEVLRGRYLGDLGVSTSGGGNRVKQMPDALRTAQELGKKAVQEMRAK